MAAAIPGGMGAAMLVGMAVAMLVRFILEEARTIQGTITLVASVTTAAMVVATVEAESVLE